MSKILFQKNQKIGFITSSLFNGTLNGYGKKELKSCIQN